MTSEAKVPIGSTIVLIVFLQYGAPLEMKDDNGSAFVSEAFAALSAKHRVNRLRSGDLAAFPAARSPVQWRV